MLEADLPASDEIFHLIALVTVLSILAPSSTGVPIAYAFALRRDENSGGKSAVSRQGAARSGTSSRDR